MRLSSRILLAAAAFAAVAFVPDLLSLGPAGVSSDHGLAALLAEGSALAFAVAFAGGVATSLTPCAERGVLWAMALHPDDRPATMEALGEVLFGSREFPAAPLLRRPIKRSPWEFALTPPESILLWAAGGLFLISLVATLMR